MNNYLQWFKYIENNNFSIFFNVHQTDFLYFSIINSFFQAFEKRMNIFIFANDDVFSLAKKMFYFLPYVMRKDAFIYHRAFILENNQSAIFFDNQVPYRNIDLGFLLGANNISEVFFSSFYHKSQKVVIQSNELGVSWLDKVYKSALKKSNFFKVF